MSESILSILEPWFNQLLNAETKQCLYVKADRRSGKTHGIINGVRRLAIHRPVHIYCSSETLCSLLKMATDEQLPITTSIWNEDDIKKTDGTVTLFICEEPLLFVDPVKKAHLSPHHVLLIGTPVQGKEELDKELSQSMQTIEA